MTKINFILCDDNAEDLQSLKSSAEDYINSRGLRGEIFCFSSPGELLRHRQENAGENVTVYLLDVVMPETDGIALGKKIRENGGSCAVIYISSSKEYALDAFSVRAFSYLLKPFSRERLFGELDECLSRLESAPPKLSIKTALGTVTVALSEIIAVEYFDHKLIFHLMDGKKTESVYRKQSFDVQAEEIMKTGDFLKVSASYLVNRTNVRGIRSDEFIMCDGTGYKITRKYIGAKQQYIDLEMSNKGFFR